MSSSRALIASLAGLLISFVFAGQAFAGACTDGKASYIGLFRDAGGGSPAYFMGNFKVVVDASGTVRYFAQTLMGDTGDLPVTGQWVPRGDETYLPPGEGPDTVGIYRNTNNNFYLSDINPDAPSFDVKNPVSPAVNFTQFLFSEGTSNTPVAGNWDGSTDGSDEVGVFRDDITTFYLAAQNVAGTAVTTIVLGVSGDTPLAGQFDSVAGDDVGVARVESDNNLYFYLRESGGAIVTQALGSSGDQALVGDWDGDGRSTPGIYRPGDNTFYLSNSTSAGAVGVDIIWPAGGAGDVALVGGWWGNCPAW